MRQVIVCVNQVGKLGQEVRTNYLAPFRKIGCQLLWTWFIDEDDRGPWAEEQDFSRKQALFWAQSESCTESHPFDRACV